MSSLATCSDVIRFWDAGGGGLELRKTTNVAASSSTSCCWNHNGQVVATAGDNGCITVLKVSGTIVPAGVLSAHERPILGVAFSSKSRKLAAGGDAGVVEVWDLKRNNSRVTMRGHRGSVTCVSFFDRDSCVAAGDDRGKVVLHRIADAPSNDESSATLPPAGGYASVTGLSMASAAAGPSTLGVSYADGGVRLWDTGSRACVREMGGKHRGAASGIQFHPHNPSLVATVGHDGVIHMTDARVAQKDGLLTSIRTDAPLTCASFHYEGRMLAVGASDGTARLIDLRTAREVGGPPKKAYAGPSPPSGGVRAVAFQRQPSSSSARPTTTPAPSGVGANGGVSPHGGGGGSSTSAKFTSPGLSRHRSAAGSAASSSASWDLKKAAAVAAGGGGGGSGRSNQMRENGGGGGVDGDGGGVHGGGVNGGQGLYGEGSGGQRRPSSGSTQQPQQQQQYHQQPAAENTSSSRGNGDYYYAPPTAAGGGRFLDPGEGAEESASALPQRHQEPYGFSSSPAAAAAAGAEGRDNHRQSFSTPPRERGEDVPTPRWNGYDARGGGGGNETARTALLTDNHGDAAAAAAVTGRSLVPPVPPPVTRRRPDSSSPERVAAGFDRRSRENGTSNGTSNGGGVISDKRGEWEAQLTTATAYSSSHGHGHDDYGSTKAFLSTPDSRGGGGGGAGAGAGAAQAGLRAAGGGVGGGGFAGNGYSSPVRAPRKNNVHSGRYSTGAGQVAGAAGAAGAAVGAAGTETDALVNGESEGAAAPPAAGSAVAAGGGGGRVVSLDRSVLEQVLTSHVTGLREELRQELRNLHVDMLRQFHSLQDEQSSALSGFEERLGGLVAENQALRAENDRLRRVY
ncbi:unnamed protein product [Pylaiella littoralis]